MRLYLLRHASTQSNLERRYLGRGTDEPLCAAGWEQCEDARGLVRADLVYASPMRRARQTAQACFPGAQVVSVSGLEEYDFGAFEGRSAVEMVDDAAYRAWVDSGCTARCPGGESREEYEARSNGALMGLLRAAEERGEEQVVVVAHGGTVMAAFHAFARPDNEGDGYFSWHVGPCKGYRATVRMDAGRPCFEDVAPIG